MLTIARMSFWWGAIAVALTGCSVRRDLDLGNDRYMISIQGSQYTGIGGVEQNFYRSAHEIAQAHGFDSFRVIEIRSGFEPVDKHLDPFAKGTIQLYNSGQSAVGSLAGMRPTGTFSGTAFVVTLDGVLLTNAHVAENCRELSVRQLDGTISAGSLLAADATNDLALIKIAAQTPVVAQLRGSPDIRQGDNVIAVGFPLHDFLSAGMTLTTGTVSALAGAKNDSRKLQVSAPIQPGNSGGPLLDQSGNVVAVVSSSLSTVAMATATGAIPENINFAIKASVARAFMEANGVTYQLARSDKPLSTAEIGDAARKYTGSVTCVR